MGKYTATTADGVRVGPGDVVYHFYPESDHVFGYRVRSSTHQSRFGIELGVLAYVPVSECYSTKEAAAAAKEDEC